MGFGVWEEGRKKKREGGLLMVKAFDPDKTSNAELINKMFTLSTVIRRFVRDPSLRCVSACVHVRACVCVCGLIVCQ